MRKLAVITSILWSILAFCQDTPPMWVDNAWRRASYPRETYIFGFVQGEVQENESSEATHQRLKNQAQAEAVASIQTSVEHVSSSVSRSDQQMGTMGYSEIVREVFQTSTTTRSNFNNIPNLAVESWQDKKTNEVFAFAWVKKSELSKHLQRQISRLLTRVEINVEEAQELIGKGEKIEARKTIVQAVEYLQELAEYQHIIEIIDTDIVPEDILLNESIALKKQVTKLYQELKNGIYIYVEGECDILGKAYLTFIQEVKEQLSDLGCSFTSDREQADWVIDIVGTTRKMNQAQVAGFLAYFVEVNVSLQITKTNTQQIIFEGAWREKGSHTNNDYEAALDAYKKHCQIVTNKIIETINK